MAGSVNRQLAPVRVVLTSSTQTPAPTSTPTTSTGTKVAVGTAAVAGGATLTVLLVSAATGWGVGKVLDRAWDKVTGKKKRR